MLRSRRGRAALAVVVALAVALAANTIVVDQVTRAVTARSGGSVVFGLQDALVAPESAKLYERVPGAKVVIRDGPGHSPMVEEPEKTLALIEDFLSRSE